MAFLTPSIIKLNYGGSVVEYPAGQQLTLSDHSRSDLSVDYDVIEKSQRMANGTMRKYVVAKKKQLSCSWDLLPTADSFVQGTSTVSCVVDGKANAKTMKRFYETYSGSPLTMTLYYGKNNSVDTSYAETINVYWDTFSFNVVKRYQNFDYWNVDAEFVEI